MQRPDFVNELHRLFRGSNLSGELTDERIGALWERYGHTPLSVWKAAVSRMLLEPARPTVSRIEQSLGWAEDCERKREVDRRNAEARDFGNRIAEATGSNLTEPFMAIQRMVSVAIGTGAKPKAIAALLASVQHTDPGTDYTNWIAALEHAGEDWRGMTTMHGGAIKEFNGRPLIRDLEPIR